MSDVRAVAQQLGLYGCTEMLAFIARLFLGDVYTWRQGALEWV